jgi:putative MATE family efflux protein
MPFGAARQIPEDQKKMKKGLFASYIAGITDTKYGETYRTIMRYLMPEYVSALLLFSIPYWLDSYFISQLESTSTYATVGITNSLIHALLKLAESLSVGATVLCGRFNGMGAFADVGRSVRDAFWAAFFVGATIALCLYVGAPLICSWYGLSPAMAELGTPFLRMRAVGVFFSFLYMSLIGFMRGIKNTKTPMQIVMLGSAVFVLFDYLLILGNCGFPALGLRGSAIASMIQYATMFVAAFAYILSSSEARRYLVDMFAPLRSPTYLKEILLISWPVALDKIVFAASYMWLGKVICPMGKYAAASFCIVREMERFALLPGIACAQVITFLVSNDLGANNWHGVKSNIKKTIFLASILVFSVLIILSMLSGEVIGIFDRKGAFTTLAATIFPLVSIISFFDILQVILSGALRGAGDVKTVMYVRLLVCLGFFIPVSYLFSYLPIENQAIKLVLIYGSFYIGTAIMSLIYINRFRGNDWKVKIVKGNT